MVRRAVSQNAAARTVQREQCSPGKERRLWSMAGPQFNTKTVRPSRPKRRFSLEQANSALPLVRRIVADIVRTHGQAVGCQQELERAGKNLGEAQARLETAMNKLEDFVDELTEVGCELKDYQTGL